MKKYGSLLLVLAVLFTQFTFVANGASPNPVPLFQADEVHQAPSGITNYLLLCVDSWDSKANNIGNTDGIVLVTLDEYAGRVILTSFLRDILMQTENGKYARMSRYVPHYGANQKAVEDFITLHERHFGIDIHHYVVVDWQMIRNIIDAVGGVSVHLTQGEAIRLRSKNAFKSEWASPYLTKDAGQYILNGEAAVYYMRIRSGTPVEGETYDFRRTSRVRLVLESIAQALVNITFEQAQAILDVVVNNTLMTNMSAVDLLSATQKAYASLGTPIEQFRIPMENTYENFTYAGGASIQIDYPVNRMSLYEYLYGSFVVRDE